MRAKRKLQADEAVLVHCTDGWDRTSQIASLVQVILDPFARTLVGFRQLVDKEWCDAGYLFGLRNAQKPVRNVGQSSPVFAQFISDFTVSDRAGGQLILKMMVIGAKTPQDSLKTERWADLREKQHVTHGSPRWTIDLDLVVRIFHYR